jgi:hypothetical protein
MSRKLLTVAALAVFALPFATARAQLGYGVAAGLAAPTGNLKNSVDMGYNVAASLLFLPPLAPVGFRFEGMFNQFNYKSTVVPSAKFNVLAGTANVMLTQPGIMGPYLIGGLGMYRSSASCSGCTGSSSNFGFNGGGGFRFGLSGFSAFAEARYHYVTGTASATSPGSYNFIPLTFGVTF